MRQKLIDQVTVLVELEGSDRPACVIETVVIYR